MRAWARCAGIILAAVAAWAQQPAPVRRVPPPMFSAAYRDALQGILDLEPKDVAELNRRLARDPDNFAARLKLIAYCMRADRIALPESRTRRVELILWLIEHHPDSEILGSPYASLGPAEMSPEQRQRAIRFWRDAIAAHGSDARLMWNAAVFYRQNDPGQYRDALERAVALAPDREPSALELGELYAGAILSGDASLAPHAAQELDRTGNAYLLEAAVRLFQNEYNRSLTLGSGNRSEGELARKYFGRAKALDPGLDQAFILPQLPPNMVGMFAPGAAPPRLPPVPVKASPADIRRLDPGSFPGLPAGIVAALRHRNCTIPQATGDSMPRSVIRGNFFAPGQSAWAVLCSNAGSSSILVFRNASGANPEELAKQDDGIYLQGDGQSKMVYSRAIEPAGRKYIVEHYRAYGGPEPPPIDHQGINDIYIGKASVVHYLYQGKWLQLSGAD